MSSPKTDLVPTLSRQQLEELWKRDRGLFYKLMQLTKELLIKQARSNINVFISYVMRQEKVESGERLGRKLKQTPLHTEMQAFVDEHPKTVIWGCVGMGKCVTKNTEFVLESGQRVRTSELRKIVARSPPSSVRVWSIDPETYEPLTLPVKAVKYNGRCSLKKVHTTGGPVLGTNLEHPYWAIQGRGWEWTPAKELVKGSAQLLMYASATPHHRPLTLDKQEAFDLGFIFGLIARNYAVRIPSKHRHLDVMGIRIRDTDPIARHYTEALITLGQIADRRALHLEQPDEKRILVFGLEKWVGKYGKHFKYYDLHKKGSRTNAPSFEAQITGITPAFLLKDMHLYNEATCLAYLAGLYATMVEDGEHNLGMVRPIWSGGENVLAPKRAFKARYRMFQHLGLLAGIRTRRYRSWLYLEGEKIVQAAKIICDCAPKLRGYFSGVAKSLENDFKAVEPAEEFFYRLTASKKSFSARKFLTEWRPRNEEGVHITQVALGYRPTYGGQAVMKSTWGVEIDDPRHSHLTSNILTHNTQQISVARSLFTLGNNLNSRILIVMSKENLAKDTLTMIKTMLLESEELREVFPELKPGDLWQAHSIRVVRTNRVLTPSIRAIGAETQIDGSRYDLIIVDDALSFKNTSSKTERDNHYSWLISVPFSREEDWTKIVVIGNAWSHDDAMHRLEKLEGWKSKRFPARDPNTGRTLFPERWPQDRIERWEKSKPPAEVRRALDCIPFSNETSRFDTEWFEKAFQRGLDILRDSNGDAVHFLPSYDIDRERTKVDLLREEAIKRGEDPMKIPMPVQVSTGVDLGFGLSEDADFTVLMTAVFFDNGDCLVINIEKGRWGSTGIIPKIIMTQKVYKSTVYLEAMFTQKWVYDIIHQKHPDLPIFPWRTDGKGTIGNKWDMIFGIESVAFDIGTGRWILPCVSIKNPVDDILYEVSPVMLQFKEACLLYVPDKSVHTADELMAAWIMLQGARLRGSHEYLAALSDIGSVYYEMRGEGFDAVEGESDERRWGREIGRDLQQYLSDAGLDKYWKGN